MIDIDLTQKKANLQKENGVLEQVKQDNIKNIENINRRQFEIKGQLALIDELLPLQSNTAWLIPNIWPKQSSENSSPTKEEQQ